MTEDEKRRRKATVGRAREKLRPFEETHPDLKDFAAFLEDFNKETERGAALAAAAFVDDLLQRILAAFLLDTPSANELLNGGNAPLGLMASRTDAAHALGLTSGQEKSRRKTEKALRLRGKFPTMPTRTPAANSSILKLVERMRSQGTKRASTPRSMMPASALAHCAAAIKLRPTCNRSSYRR
jgi:hypothetical protein